MGVRRAAGAFAVLAALLLLGCGPRQALPEGLVLDERPDQESWDVRLRIEVADVPRAEIEAAYLARYERPDSSFARFGPAPGGPPIRVVVRVYDEAGAPSATVEADRITYLDDRRRFVAEGRVVVEAVGGRRLEGERLVWDEAARQITSDGFVRITTPTERIQGTRLVADEALETYRLGRITGEVQIEDP